MAKTSINAMLLFFVCFVFLLLFFFKFNFSFLYSYIYVFVQQCLSASDFCFYILPAIMSLQIVNVLLGEELN